MGGAIMDMVSQHWNTPEHILAVVREVFGGQIGLDPCDNVFSSTQARVSYFGPPHIDGLEAPWDEKTIFVNPPYGRGIEKWIAKAKVVAQADPEKKIILLIPVATETVFWHEHIWDAAQAICFLKGRVSFPLRGKKRAGATRGSAIVYHGYNRFPFIAAFRSMGRVVTL